MSIREDIIRKWFGIWLTAEDTGITASLPKTRSTSRTGDPSTMAPRRSGTGMQSGTPGDRCSGGIVGSFFMMGIRQSWSGVLRML